MAFGVAELQLLLKARDDTSRALKSSERGIRQFGKVAKMAALGAGIAIAGIGIATVKMAADFERSMAEVRTLMPEITDTTFGELQRGVLAFSKEMGIATDQVVPALYQAISAGVPSDNVLDFMGVAARASIGGAAELETVVDGLTTVVNSYGREVMTAQQASDQIFTAVRLGKTDFDQMSRALFNVLPTANVLGISFEEIAGQLSTITSVGVPTTIATTTLRQAFVEAAKSGTVLDKTIRNLHGKGMTELVAEGRRATDILQSVRVASEKAGITLLEVFSSVEAANAAIQITGPNFAKATDFIDQAAKSGGEADAAFAKVANTASFKFQKAMNSLTVTGTQLGLLLLPTITRALDVVVKALEGFSAWFEANRPTIQATINAIIGSVRSFTDTFLKGLGPIMSAVGGLFGFIIRNKPLLVAAIVVIGIAIVLALGPISGPVVAIVALISLFGLLRKGFEAVARALPEVIKGPVNAVVGIINTLIRMWNALEFEVPAFKAGPFKTPSFTIGVPDIPELPTFAKGGVVAGPVGAPQLAVVHGGERITPAGQAAAGNTYNFHFPNYVGTRRELTGAILEALVGLERQGSIAEITT